MMHRYVALVATAPPGMDHAALEARLAARFAGWNRLLATPAASVWQLDRGPSRLAGHRVGREACVVGRVLWGGEAFDQALGSDDPVGAVRAGWGAYVAFKVEGDRTVVLRDPTGRIEAWRLPIRGGDLLFSHYADVHDLRAGRARINWDYVAYHLDNNWIRGRETALDDVTELLPGEAWVYASGPPEPRIGWRPETFAQDRFTTRAEAAAAIRGAAEASVGAWGSLYGRIALDLSGGLDSAIVLGLLSRLAPDAEVTGVNYVVPHAEGDERAFARDAAALHGASLLEQEVSLRTVGDAPSFARRLMRPTVKAFPVGYQELGGEIVRRLGSEALFTGTGGDHLFYDHLGVDAAADHLRRHGVGPDLVRTSHLLAQVSGDTIWNAFAAAARDAVGRPPEVRSLLRGGNELMAAAVRDAVDHERFAHPWVAAACGEPPAKRRQILNLCELQRHYMRYGRADVAEEVHPLYAQPLMEACLRTPAAWFVAGGVPRGFARAIFADVLPASIRERRTKGVNTSHWYQVMLRGLPWLRELLLDGRLASRGLIDRAKAEAALTAASLAVSKRFSPLVNCATTEMWIRQTEADHAGDGSRSVGGDAAC